MSVHSVKSRYIPDDEVDSLFSRAHPAPEMDLTPGRGGVVPPGSIDELVVYNNITSKSSSTATK